MAAVGRRAHQLLEFSPEFAERDSLRTKHPSKASDEECCARRATSVPPRISTAFGKPTQTPQRQTAGHTPLRAATCIRRTN